MGDLGRQELIETISSEDENWGDDWNECPTYSDEAELPSVGSAQHQFGTCRRCCFFPKGRCANGKNCEFCHLPHDKPRTTKPRVRCTRRRGRHQAQDIGGAVNFADRENITPSRLNAFQMHDSMRCRGELVLLRDAVFGEGVVQLQTAIRGEGQLMHDPPNGSSYDILKMLQLPSLA